MASFAIVAVRLLASRTRDIVLYVRVEFTPTTVAVFPFHASEFEEL